MAGLQDKWQLKWNKRCTSIQTSEEVGFRVQVHERMMRGTMRAYYNNKFIQAFLTNFCLYHFNLSC